MTNERCVYCCTSDTGTTIFTLHVDNILVASSSPAEIDHFRNKLKSCWEIFNLGPAKFTLGISITHDTPTKTISICQSAFINHLLKKFNQSDAHPCDTPMVTGLRLSQPDKSVPVPSHVLDWMKCTPYHELIGSLNYLAMATCPNIAFAVGKLATFLDCYHPEHWQAAIRILQYVKGTRNLCLSLGGNSSPLLVGYSDLDYANCPDTSQSISGYCFSPGSGTIS